MNRSNSRFTEADATLAKNLFEHFKFHTRDTEGVSRPAYSEIETESLKYLADFARGNGLHVEYDALENAIFSLPQDAKATQYVLIGSHIDSVPQGGNFDGLAGILAGLLCLLKAKQVGLRFKRPVKVIALRGEESAWFGPCYISSKALLGHLHLDELAARHKEDGRTLAEHMHDIGIDMEPIERGDQFLSPSSVLEYLELHIEQGPLLVEKKLPAGIVTGIRGNFRHRNIRCIGEPGHSGAVPRAYRHDPVFALADLLTRLDESWLTLLQKGNDLVLTSGIVGTDPNRHAMTRIPDEVGFSLDVRSQSKAVLNGMREMLAQEMATIEADRGVRFILDDEHRVEPALCDSRIVHGLSRAMNEIGYEPFHMASGAGHDAAVFANSGISTGMVFVRNRNGSHNPLEAMDISDFMVGTEIFYSYLMET
ncbi:Zn-dependent hydrolase [Pseudovibrio exalbescens]|uniref:Zn-dependent hydrolase n=1 Tax=Pseudovibrio exalbescens TaxID=197461 RepID=UPI002366E15E|nr:Zn-dependent hydrolase [Pseudovibrio exalbescens]MDD7909927.1 Zn-dependent hydrolase [Pseudovibrio exalbescens]